MKKRLGLILLLCISFTIARAQADTAIADTTAIADSVKDAMLEANSRLLQEAEEARKIDSARKAALEEELSQLKTTDNLKKQELLDELRQIRSADSERVARQQARIDSLKKFSKRFSRNAISGYNTIYIYQTRTILSGYACAEYRAQGKRPGE